VLGDRAAGGNFVAVNEGGEAISPDPLLLRFTKRSEGETTGNFKFSSDHASSILLPPTHEMALVPKSFSGITL